MSREIPILFNSAMVRANRAGLKWQTRRRVKPDPKFPHHNILKYGLPYAADASAVWWHSLETDRVGILQDAPWRVGDTLWVREAWRVALQLNDCSPSEIAGEPEMAGLHYEADRYPASHRHGKLRPSIHMPRWACRNTYTVTGVRAERVRDISEADAIAEGIDNDGPGNWFWPQGSDYYPTAREAYAALYESINGPGSFDRDWVWVIEYDNPARSK